MTKRVLVVDDSAAFRSTAAELLTMRGLDVAATVADGDEAATAVVAGGCPDGILLDVNLPGPDGFVVSASLDVLCPCSRIVLTSGDFDEVPTSALIECGAVAFVPKAALATADLSRLFAPDGGADSDRGTEEEG